MKHILKVILILGFSVISSACSSSSGRVVDSLGVSSDGRYVITAHGGGDLILWDISKKEKKTASPKRQYRKCLFSPRQS